MASAGAKRQPETQNGAEVGLAQIAESPEVTQAFQSGEVEVGGGGGRQEKRDCRWPNPLTARPSPASRGAQALSLHVFILCPNCALNS